MREAFLPVVDQKFGARNLRLGRMEHCKSLRGTEEGYGPGAARRST